MSRFLGGWARLSLVVGAAAFSISTGSAQLLPEIPKAPPTTNPTPVLPPPRPVSTLPAPTPMDTLMNAPPQGLPPLPGSVADQYAQELQAREDLTTNTPLGNTYRFLPNTLLWEPGLAVKRDPRMQFIATSLKNYNSSYSLDTEIGGTIGLFRWNFAGSDSAVQLDIFGLVITRLAPDDLVAADYRFGIPLTWERGPWSAKIGYEHTSSHLGDKHLQALGLVALSTAKDEIAAGLSRVFYDQFRLYGNAAYAVGFQVPNVETTPRHQVRGDIGFDWYDRKPTGFRGTPFLASNLEWRGDEEFQTNITVQAGWLWKNPYQRFGTARIFAEYYHGRSPYGQLLQDTESYYSVGFGFDY